MESPLSRKIGVAAALMISCSAVYWLFSLLPLRHSILFRIGFANAVLCALGGLAFFWGALLSYIAKHREWSPRTCHKAGISILVPFTVLCFVVPRDQFLLAADWAACLAIFAGYVCRKLAYPGLTDEEAHAPEPPLTLFPK